jgi:enolase
MSRITSVHARQILDSRGNPTVEVDVKLDSGAFGRAAVPSGASTGTREAVELRDGGPEFGGKGVAVAVGHVNGEIAEAVLHHRAIDQSGLDSALIGLDGTPDKSRLGANAILGVSLATARAAAAHLGLPLWQYLRPDDVKPTLPMPMLNVLNGGAHADNGIDFQENLIVPVGGLTFSHALQIAAETYQALKQELRSRGFQTAVGDEGGFAPALNNNREALELLVAAIARAGFRPGDDVALALDPAVSALRRDDGRYEFRSEGGMYSAGEVVDYWEEIVNTYPIFSLEDAMAEDDWNGWKLLTDRLGDKVQLIGDDIFVTDQNLLRRGIDTGIGNSVLIKLNQIGTLTETLQTIELARANGYLSVISHRSGETDDTFIADLAVATGVGQIKTGAPARGERVAKYNQLLRIEEELGPDADFPIVIYPGRSMPDSSNDAPNISNHHSGQRSTEPSPTPFTPPIPQ